MDSCVRSPLQLIKELPQMQQFILKGVISKGRQLGRGSFGSVIEVQLHGGAICAGKKIHETFLHPRNEGVKQVIDKFVTECDLLSKMRHPNIVHFYGLAFIDDSSRPVLVMERLDRSLDDFLENTEAKDVMFSIRLSILHDVAKGLVFLHSHQPPIAHRDLTAKNILLTTMKKACIADLGNSRMIEKETLSRKLSLAPGTLVYMPPEAMESPVAYDISLDIFSFGHTALFVFCHRFPSSLLGANYSDPKSRASNKLTPRTEVERRSEYFKDLHTQIPTQVVELVKSCLDNFPKQRPTAVVISELLDGHKKQAEECDRTMEKLQACSVSNSSGMDETFSRSTTATNTHMTNIKNGNRYMMEMQVAQGRRNSRKTYIFQLDNKRLKYYSKLNDRRCKELKLENVRTVLPLYDEPTRFTVHFQHKGEEQEWHLRAETEEERDCWIKVLRDATESLSDDIPSPQTSKNDLAYEYQYDFDPKLVAKKKVSSKDVTQPQQENMRHRSDTTPVGDFLRKSPHRKQRQKQPTYSLYVPSSPANTVAYSGFNLEANQSYVSRTELLRAHDIPVLQEPASLYCVTDLLDGSSKADESDDYDDIIISPKQKRIVDEGQFRAPFLPKPQTYRKKPTCSPGRAVSPTQQYSPEHHKMLNIEGAKVQLSPVRSYGSSLKPPAPYPESVTAQHRPRTPKQGTSRPLKDLLVSLHIPKDRLFDQKFITKGEFGNIFHAKLLNLTGEEVDVAVKTLQICKDATERRNFEREMAISADPRLKHPNIVKVYGLVEGVDQIVMEYLPSGNLKQFLCKTSKPLNWLVKYMLDIAMGMAFLSERGLIHRDLAARNILMASGGENCKVSDFGLLRQLPDDMNYYIDRSSGKCPIRWMAPESLGEKKFSFASDVWSYGIVAWEIFNPHCVPFEEYDNVQVVIKISHGAGLKIPTHCPEEIETIMQSCWKEKPMDRPTFSQLATLLAHKIHAF